MLSSEERANLIEKGKRAHLLSASGKGRATIYGDLTDELEAAHAELTRIEQALERAATEAGAIRSAYLDFWGAHSSSDIERVGRRPKMPETPALDAIRRTHLLGDNEGKTN